MAFPGEPPDWYARHVASQSPMLYDEWRPIVDALRARAEKAERERDEAVQRAERAETDALYLRLERYPPDDLERLYRRASGTTDVLGGFWKRGIVPRAIRGFQAHDADLNHPAGIIHSALWHLREEVARLRKDAALRAAAPAERGGAKWDARVHDALAKVAQAAGYERAWFAPSGEPNVILERKHPTEAGMIQVARLDLLVVPPAPSSPASRREETCPTCGFTIDGNFVNGCADKFHDGPDFHDTPRRPETGEGASR